MCDVLAVRGVALGTPQLTAHALAVLRILWKVDNATRSLPSDRLAHLVDWLREHGHAVPPARPEEIDRAEVNILRVLGWQVVLPSLHSWLSAFCSRFRVLTKLSACDGTDFAPILAWVWKRSYMCGTAVAMQKAVAGKLAPRILAAGLLGLCFVGARALPLQDLRPEDAEADEWERIYTQAMGPAPDCNVSLEVRRQVVQFMAFAFDVGPGELREACSAAAAALLGTTAVAAAGDAATA